MSRTMLPFIICLLGLFLFSAFNIFGIKPELMQNHLISWALAIAVFILFSRIPITVWRTNVTALYVLSVLGLFLTLFFAPSIRGARRWFDILGFSLQLSEYAKPFVLMYLAHFMASRKRVDMQTITTVILLGGFPFFLVLRQPDLGTSLNYLIMIGSMLFLAGTSIRFFIGCVVFLVTSSPLIWAFLHDYQRNRILGFLDPTYDPQGITYNVQQAIIAIGSGAFLGKGLGLGTQSQFRFLPEFYTDFAFASLVEQFGFLGGLAVITLLLALIITVLSIAYRSRTDMESFLFCAGVALLLFLGMFINIGMNTGILPVTGIPLPFITYGGSSMIATMMMLGIVYQYGKSAR